MVTPLPFLPLLPQVQFGGVSVVPCSSAREGVSSYGAWVGDTLTALWLGWLVRQALASSLAVAELRKRL